MSDYSWISLHRRLRSSGIYKDSQAVHLWVHLLLSANHKDKKVLVGNGFVEIKTGQLLTGRKALSKATGINESKIFRLLKLFESDRQIEQQKTTKYTVISIVKYSQYQRSEQQTNNKRTTNEQQLNTNNNNNNINKDNKDQKTARFAPPTITELQNYITEKNIFSIDAEIFFNHYEQNGWKVGKNKMKSWKLAISGWHKRNTKQNNGGNNANRKLSAVEQVEQATRSRNNF